MGVLPVGVPASVLSFEYPKRYRIIAEEFG
jgi:hypothetical protein